MKKISFRSILNRPSYCTPPILSADLKPPLLPLGSTNSLGNFDDGNKTKTIAKLDQKSGESHQKLCSGSHIVSVVGEGLNQQLFLVSHALKLEQATQS